MESVFMTAIHIRSVCHLSGLTIPLSQTERRHLILTGKNGSGKTSVLKGLVSYFNYIVSGEFYIEEDLRNKVTAYQQQVSHADNSEKGRANRQQAEQHANFYGKYLTHYTEGAIADCTSLALLRERYQQGQFVLAYFADNRSIEVTISKNIEKVDLKPFYTINDTPSRELAKYLVNLKTTQAFAQTSGNQVRAQEISAWFDRFQDIMRRIFDDETLTLEFDIETFQFSIRMAGRGPFDFNTMSMGYAAVFDIIGDLIMRMEAQHRYDLEGIVLIDEIETHLHVGLQKKIVPILTHLFPNLQLVLTTHSPFVLNSAENAVVFDLEKHMLAENGLTNLPYEGIVEGYFDADLLSQTLREKFGAYRALVGKPALTDADYVQIAALEQYLDEVPDYLALGFAAEYNRLKLELEMRG